MKTEIRQYKPTHSACLAVIEKSPGNNEKCHICVSSLTLGSPTEKGVIKHYITCDKLPDMLGDPPEATWFICLECQEIGWKALAALDGLIHYTLHRRKTVPI